MGQQGGVCCHRNGEKVVLVTYGTLLQNAMEAADILSSRGIEPGVLRLLTVAPLPSALVAAQLPQNAHVVVLEEVCGGSGICQALAWDLAGLRPDCHVSGIDLGHRYIPHGSIASLHQYCGLMPEQIADFVMEARCCEN